MSQYKRGELTKFNGYIKEVYIHLSTAESRLLDFRETVRLGPEGYERERGFIPRMLYDAEDALNYAQRALKNATPLHVASIVRPKTARKVIDEHNRLSQMASFLEDALRGSEKAWENEPKIQALLRSAGAR